VSIAPTVSIFIGPLIAGALIDAAGFQTAFMALGLLPLGSVAEGARGAGSECGSSTSSGAQPVPLSLLVVRGAAVAAPGDCRGHAPGYTAEQRQQLRARPFNWTPTLSLPGTGTGLTTQTGSFRPSV
jgi:hypothetical protein